MRFSVALILAAGCIASSAVHAAMSGAVDQYPGDPFAFVCAVPAVNVTQDGATPQECSLMLTACVDAATEWPCSDDPNTAKPCMQAHEQCFTMVQDLCWPLLVE